MSGDVGVRTRSTGGGGRAEIALVMGTVLGRRDDDTSSRGQAVLMGTGQEKGAQRDQRNTINEALCPVRTRWCRRVTEAPPQIEPTIADHLAQSEVIGSVNQPMMTSPPQGHPTLHRADGEVLTTAIISGPLILAVPPPPVGDILTPTLHIDTVPHHHTTALQADDLPPLIPQYHHLTSGTEGLPPPFDDVLAPGP